MYRHIVRGFERAHPTCVRRLGVGGHMMKMARPRHLNQAGFTRLVRHTQPASAGWVCLSLNLWFKRA